MTHTTIVIAAALAVAVTLPAVPAQAQSPRTFVSAAGNDGNPCSFAAPCRHFQAAVNATSLGGEVDALDPAGYGPITISHAITIEGQGWSYIAPPASGNAITINAGASDSVTIHGVSLDGVGIAGGTSGILFTAGGSLTVTDCVVRNYSGDGLGFFVATTATLVVSNSFFQDTSGAGIDIEALGSGRITTSIDRSTFSHNNYGVYVQGVSGNSPIDVAVTDSVASNNSAAGFYAESATSHSVINLSLTRVLAEGNATGFQANGTNAILWLAQSTLTGSSSHGFEIGPNTGGVIKTYGDNNLAAGNSTNFGSLTSAAKQ